MQRRERDGQKDFRVGVTKKSMKMVEMKYEGKGREEGEGKE